jgi:DNA-binding NarL/FixJ family response regulator
MPDKKIKTYIVDDHALIIEGLKSALKEAENIEVCGSALTTKACLEYFQHQTADVLLLDINLPDGNGIDLCAELLKLRPSLKIIGLSIFNQRSYISKLMESGARGYIIKNTGIGEICEAIRQVSRGHIFISQEAGDALYKLPPQSDADDTPPLTRREKEILKFLAEGFTAPEIADKLFLSHLTIESHRRNIMAKLQAKNTAMLIKIAMERNLL